MIITFNQILVFFLIFARFSGMMIFAPFFDMKFMSLAKVGIAFWFSALVIFIIPLPQQLPVSMTAFFFAVWVDFMIGVMIGFAAKIIVSAIQFSGSIMDAQAGLSSASVLDPTSGTNSALLERLMNMLSILFFLLLNGHHMVLSAVFESFTVIPIGSPINFSQGSFYLVEIGVDLFKIGLQLSMPIIMVVFMIDFSFGILNRVAEQVNVFQLGFQVKPVASVFIFMGITVALTQVLSRLIEGVMEHVIKLLGFLST